MNCKECIFQVSKSYFHPFLKTFFGHLRARARLTNRQTIRDRKTEIQRIHCVLQ